MNQLIVVEPYYKSDPRKFGLPTKASSGAPLQIQSEKFRVPTVFRMNNSVGTWNFSDWTCEIPHKPTFVGTLKLPRHGLWFAAVHKKQNSGACARYVSSFWLVLVLSFKFKGDSICEHTVGMTKQIGIESVEDIDKTRQLHVSDLSSLSIFVSLLILVQGDLALNTPRNNQPDTN